MKVEHPRSCQCAKTQNLEVIGNLGLLSGMNWLEILRKDRTGPGIQSGQLYLVDNAASQSIAAIIASRRTVASLSAS